VGGRWGEIFELKTDFIAVSTEIFNMNRNMKRGKGGGWSEFSPGIIFPDDQYRRCDQEMC